MVFRSGVWGFVFFDFHLHTVRFDSIVRAFASIYWSVMGVALPPALFAQWRLASAEMFIALERMGFGKVVACDCANDVCCVDAHMAFITRLHTPHSPSLPPHSSAPPSSCAAWSCSCCVAAALMTWCHSA